VSQPCWKPLLRLCNRLIRVSAHGSNRQQIVYCRAVSGDRPGCLVVSELNPIGEPMTSTTLIAVMSSGGVWMMVVEPWEPPRRDRLPS